MTQFPTIPKSNLNQIASRIESIRFFIENQENVPSELHSFLMKELDTLIHLVHDEKQRTETLSNLAQLLANRI